MSFQNKSARTEIISLKKPTVELDFLEDEFSSVLDKVIEKVPKPKEAVPSFGLPKWKAIPLESKIPMVPGPKGAYNFSRQKLGKKLWISSPDAEFNLSDPCNYEIELKYDGFHDKYLTEFYKRPINIQRMIKLGFVTENLDVKCSINDYNMYRKYLKLVHNDSVKKELRKKAELIIEKKVLNFAEEKSKKDMERLRKMGTAVNYKEKQERIKKTREEILKAKMRKFKDQTEKIEKTRREDIRRRIEKNKEKMEKSKQVRYTAAKLERKKLIKTFADQKRKENVCKKMRQMRLSKKEEERKQLIQDRWKKKEHLQIEELKKEEFLKRCVEEERQIFIQEYNKKIEKERRRMQNLFEKTRKFVKCHAARYISEGKRRTCCKVRKCCQGKGQESNAKLKDSGTIQTKISQISSKNIKRTNGDDKRRGKKLKTKHSKKKPQQNKTMSTTETNGDLESEETETISCIKIIPEDDCKSKCECERVKFFKRYEIPELLV